MNYDHIVPFWELIAVAFKAYPFQGWDWGHERDVIVLHIKNTIKNSPELQICQINKFILDDMVLKATTFLEQNRFKHLDTKKLLKEKGYEIP